LLRTRSITGMSEATKDQKAITPKLSAPQAAVDELYRELQVRLRCFPRWIEEGRVSRTDAIDRIDRLNTALQLLKGVVEKEATSEN
jgi:hypothetical protein